MQTTEPNTATDLLGLTADLVSAYVTNNRLHRGELVGLIASVHDALAGLGGPKPAAEPEKPQPAVSIKRSITPDHLISLEDGKPYRSLKRHLTGRGLTPDQYRAKWGLPTDYPMVAPSYAKQRSELAKSLGLGQLRKRPAVEAAAPEAPREAASEPAEPASAKVVELPSAGVRGRKKAATEAPAAAPAEPAAKPRRRRTAAPSAE